MHPQKAIIIGSGIAGIAAAIRLAVQGFEVRVYEKNDQPGGKLSWFEQNGYKFDAGPSLFTQPCNIEELFELASEPIEKYFTYQPVEIACKYFYSNGKIINAYTDKYRFATELSEQVNEDPLSVNEYLNRAEKLYYSIGDVFLHHSLHKRNTWLNRRIIKALSALKLSYLFNSLDKYNQIKFRSQETIQLFNRFATYNGSNPFKAPAMLSIIPHLEQNEGVFYPQGGMISITNALYQLAIDKGVKFHFNTPVQKIIYNEDKVCGVVVNNENIMSSTVISNADAYFTYKDLLNDNSKAQDLLKQERSSSAIVFYWGIKKNFPQLELHNIFFSSNYKQEFDAIFNKGIITEDPTVYINITSKQESSQAPHGCENWFVMINVPPNKGQNWEQIKVQSRISIIKKLSSLLQEDIEPLIQTETILDPLILESQTASYGGSLYGTSSNSKMAAFLRHPNFTNSIKGLYFCGGTVHPGGGIPLCLKSAKIVSELIRSQKHQKH